MRHLVRWFPATLVTVLAAAGTASAARYVVPVSAPQPGSGGAASAANFITASHDGAKVFFVSTRPLVPEDTDTDADVYMRDASGLSLVSRPAPGVSDASASASVPVPANPPVSADGRFVVFETSEQMTSDDSDGGEPDLYLRDTVAGTTRLVSVESQGFSFYTSSGNYPNVRLAPDGTRVVFSTDNQIAGGELDFTVDVFAWDDGTTTLLSTGANNVDVNLVGASTDTQRLLLETDADLLSDGDPGIDLYALDGGTLSLLTPGTANDITYGGQLGDASLDATHVAFTSSEQLVPADTDSASDVYEATGGSIGLVSEGSTDDVAGLQAVSGDGTHIFFTTLEALVPADTDSLEDIYARVNGTTTELVSGGTNTTGLMGAFGHHFARATPDGLHVFFDSYDSFGDDADNGFLDSFMSGPGEPTRLSVGEINDDGFAQASFAGFSDDLTRFVFQVDLPFTTADHNNDDDLYERAGGHTTLVTPDAPDPCTLPSFDCPPVYLGLSGDGKRVWFSSKQRLLPGDTDDEQDIYESRVATTPAVATGAGGPLHVTEGDPPAAIVPGLTVGDDYGELFGASVQITGGAAPADALAAGAHPGLTATVVPAGDRVTFAGRAPLAVYRDALRAVTFASGEQAASDPRTVTVTVDNGGATGSVTRTVIIDGVDDAPTLTLGDRAGDYVENAAPLPVAPALTVADVDNTTLASATVRLVDPVAGEDRLAASAPDGLALSVAPDGTSVTFTGSAAPAVYRDALRSVTYADTSDAPDTRARHLAFSVDDGAGATGDQTASLGVRAVNDAPVVTTSESALQVAPGAPGAVDAGVTVADVDSATLAGATVRIASGYVDGADLLSIAATPALTASVTGGTLRLTGAAPRDAYVAALRSVRFSSSQAGARAVAITVDDGSDTSAPGVRAILINPLAVSAPGPSLPARRARVDVARRARLEGRTLQTRCVVDRPAITSCRVSVHLRIAGRLVKVGSTRHRPDAHGLRSVSVPVVLDDRALHVLLHHHRRAAAVVGAVVITWPGPRTFRPAAHTTLVLGGSPPGYRGL